MQALEKIHQWKAPADNYFQDCKSCEISKHQMEHKSNDVQMHSEHKQYSYHRISIKQMQKVQVVHVTEGL